MRTALLSVVLLPLSAGLLAGAPAPVRPPNLLVNGSFEEGPPLGNFLPLNPGSTAIKGWVVTRGQVDLVGSHWPAAHGKRSIDLHGSPGLGGVRQTFPTKPSQRYRVTFSLAANPEGSVPKKVLGVSAAATRAVFTVDATGKTVRDLGWQKKSWVFRALGSRTTLEFYTLMKEDPACGPAIDDVCVVEAP
jgi:choice-of-anchor C domain-containing protein